MFQYHYLNEQKGNVEENVHNDNFDIEQYRRENPMDYIKAIDILKHCSNKDEVFG